MNLDQVHAHLRKGCDELVSATTGLLALLGKHPSSSSAHESVPDATTKIEYFKIFREYRVTEHNLLNHRLTWNLALQGFLFATYGVTLEKLASELQPDGKVDQLALTFVVAHLRQLLTMIPWVGLSLSMCIFMAAIGAFLSLRKLNKYWLTNIESRPPADIPNPNGGRSPYAFWLAMVPGIGIPATFTAVWGFILLRR